MPIASLILGILGLVFCWNPLGWVCGVLALIFGVLAIKKHNKAVKTGGTGPGKGMAIAGVVLSLIGLVTTTLVVMVIMAAVGVAAHAVKVVADDPAGAAANMVIASAEVAKTVANDPRTKDAVAKVADAAVGSAADPKGGKEVKADAVDPKKYAGFNYDYPSAGELPNDSYQTEFMASLGEFEKHILDVNNAETQMQYDEVMKAGTKLARTKFNEACKKYQKDGREIALSGTLIDDVKELNEVWGKYKNDDRPCYGLRFVYKGLSPNKVRVIMFVVVEAGTAEAKAKISSLKKGDKVNYKGTLFGYEEQTEEDKKYAMNIPFTPSELLNPTWTYGEKIQQIVADFNNARANFLGANSFVQEKRANEMKDAETKMIEARKPFGNDSWSGITLGGDNKESFGYYGGMFERDFGKRMPKEVREQRAEKVSMYYTLHLKLISAEKVQK